MTDDAPPRLFVYGSLQPGAANAHVLADLGGTWAAGTVRGVLHDQGWGAGLGFPALVLAEAGDAVPGQVLTAEGLADRWAALDAFEGDEYSRVTTTVQLRDGGTVRAAIYVLRAGDG